MRSQLMHVSLSPIMVGGASSHDDVTAYYCGIDIGGTGIKIGLVDDHGRTAAWTSIPTEPTHGFDAALERIVGAVERLAVEAGIAMRELRGAGCGIPGLIDVARGTLIGAHNLPGWDNTPVAALLSEKLGMPVAFANDANAASFGEYWMGGGRGHRSSVLITLGTGVGGGIVLNGELIHGAHDFGGELGHILIDSRDDARLCGCGQRGHLEAYCGAVAVKQRTEEALASGLNGALSVLRNQGHAPTALDVADAAKTGDATALRIVRETARYLGLGITTILHMLDPEVILIGGAMTFGGADDALGREFLSGVRDEVRRRALRIPAEKAVIEFAVLGGSAGYIGAAGLARQAARKTQLV